MKKIVFLSLFALCLPWTLVAQSIDDDLYYIPSKDKKEKNINKRDNIFMIILSFCDVIAVTVLFLLYGPYNGFRDWLVTTAMGTMNHQYLATTFYNMDRIEEII